MDKTLQHAESKGASVAQSQGGTNRNQGPDGASGPAPCGDAATKSTFFTKQDGNRETATKNKYHDV